MNFIYILAQAVTPSPSPEPSPTPDAATSVAAVFTPAGLNAALIYTSVALALYVILMIIGRWVKRRLHVPLGWFYQLFAFSMALFLPLQFFAVPGELELGEHIDAAVVLTGAFVAISFLRHYLFDIASRGNNNGKVPKFLSQIISIIIFLVALAIVLQVIYGQEVPGLLAGAGIAGLVLGLALQDTLSNIFSGFAIYFGGQFKAGDWLKVGDQNAEIMEVNWRSTRLRTEDNIYLDIPNSNITKETVVNFTHPTPLHALRIEIGLDYEVPPTRVRQVLIEATQMAEHVLCEPAPIVFLKDFAASSITYEIKFWMNDHSKYEEANSAVRTNLWYALRRANISIPYPIQLEASYEPSTPVVDRKSLIGGALGKIFFAECLNETQIAQLINRAQVNHFGQGEQIIRQGQHDSSMYVIMEGRADIVVEASGVTRTVATIGAGDCIGEMSLLTGECRSATVLALEDTHVVEISKSILAPLIAESPELLEVLSDLLARRRMANEGVLARALSEAQLCATHEDYRSGFLTKLKSFFAI
jgi:small-conductance mechanosensitive channel